ncbi:hypothetical protein K5D33_04675 [Pseudomonas cichorii]|nr:I78 family peptidase inhibitor [Pseudomonas cichorii]MBX8521208.1 hypothetical protein [Pseudomonas cichorii]MBX8534009.1 hypothetical protein [Pseudomonas cichorii]MBX8539247.1 hypothetical protein [Pseudomonas cichorii]MBX8553876.1 hypothetical protein [Pseudomonas cichorii]MBX8579175.1 hypothetical protein [Pseudomonas cichorii]
MTNEQITQALQYLIGTRYLPSLKAYISELTDRARVLGPGDFSTREFDLNRVQINTDQAGLISSFTFG